MTWSQKILCYSTETMKNQEYNQSISESINQSINQSINLSINQSIHRSTNQPIYKLTWRIVRYTRLSYISSEVWCINRLLYVYCTTDFYYESYSCSHLVCQVTSHAISFIARNRRCIELKWCHPSVLITLYMIPLENTMYQSLAILTIYFIFLDYTQQDR